MFCWRPSLTGAVHAAVGGGGRLVNDSLGFIMMDHVEPTLLTLFLLLLMYMSNNSRNVSALFMATFWAVIPCMAAFRYCAPLLCIDCSLWWFWLLMICILALVLCYKFSNNEKERLDVLRGRTIQSVTRERRTNGVVLQVKIRYGV